MRIRFNAGDKVEVKCDDVGFRGAWYEGTVVRSMPRLRRYVVVYDSLMCDDDESKPLRETVVSGDMRPRPPPRADPSEPYVLFQAVEAYHNDGWWIGVVYKVHGEVADRYSVCFPISREEIEFEASELRPHLNWVNNEWIAPEKQQEIKDMVFSSGMQVEVIRGKGNSLSAWFIATIVKLVGKNNFLIEYESLRTDNGEPLKEMVDSQYIRPCPHISEFKDFKLLDEVEAFFCDGWCAGLITKIHTGSRYIVSSKHWVEEMEFTLSELRIYYDWIDGKWIHASKEKSIKSLKLGEVKTFVKRQQSLAPKFAQTADASVCVSTASDSVGKDSDLETGFEKIPLQGQIGSCKKSRKGETLKGIARLFDCLMFTGVSETPTQADREFEVATPSLEERGKLDLTFPLVNEKHHHKIPSMIRSESQLIGTNDSLNPSLKEINDESPAPTTFSQEPSDQQTPGTNEQSVRVENHTDLQGVGSSVVNATKRKRKFDVWKTRRCRRKVRHTAEFTNGTEKRKQGRLSMLTKFGREPSVQQTPLGTNERPTRAEIYTDSKGVSCLWMNATRRKRKDDAVNSHHTVGTIEGTEERKRGRLSVSTKFSHVPSLLETSPGKNEQPTKAKHADSEGMNATRWKRNSDVWDRRRRNVHHTVANTQGTEKRKRGRPRKSKDGETQGRPRKSKDGETQGRPRKSKDRETRGRSRKSKDGETRSRPQKSKDGETRGRPQKLKDGETESLIERNALVDDALNVNESQSMPQVESAIVVDTSKKEEQVQKMSEKILSLPLLVEARNSDNQPGVASTEEFNEALQMPFGSHSPKNTLNGNLSHDAFIVSLCEELTSKAGGETLGESHSMPETGGSTSDKDRTVEELSKTKVSSPTKSQEISKFGIQLNETTRKEQDENLQMPLSGQVPNNMLIEKRTTVTDLTEPSRTHLPFEKKFPIWEQIEAMEAFHVMPQQPHYSPLQQYYGELREGMAIGLMVTFSNLVANIGKSRIHDTHAVFEDRLKALVHLEGHGFNVQQLRARLEELLRIKGDRGLAEKKRASLEDKLSELQDEGHGLRKRLIELEEEMDSVMAWKESIDSMIFNLQMDVQASKQECASAEHEFDAALAAAW